MASRYYELGRVPAAACQKPGAVATGSIDPFLILQFTVLISGSFDRVASALGADIMSKTWKQILRAVAEIGFIVFLFYTNLVMGEFTRAHKAQSPQPLVTALWDVFTWTNALIALVAAFVGYVVIEAIRTYLSD